MNLPDDLRSPLPLRWSTGRGIDVGALFESCVTGDASAVRALLDRDPSLVRTHYAYRTALYFAVRENRCEIAEILLERGADPLSLAVDDGFVEIAEDRGYREMAALVRDALRRRCGASPEGEAIARAIRDRNHGATLRLLEAEPALIRAGDERGNQPIHWSVMTRQPELVDLLLERGADIDARRFDGARPIHLTNGDYHYRGWRDVPESTVATPDDLYRHLVRRGASVDLGMAAAKGDVEGVRAILDRDPASVNRVAEYRSYYVGCGAPLKNAAAGGHLEIVRLMLERGADPNLPEEGIAPEGHALYSAVAQGHHAIARLLLEHGAHPNPEVESSADALSRALGRDDRAMVDLLCSYGAHRRPHLLAHDNDLETAAAVFAANSALADDVEALGSAASNDFVRLLLRHRPRLPERVTVAKDPETNELLFRHRMDPGRADWLGVTPLHRFARDGRIPIAVQFLSHGASIHARDEVLQSTPLGYAAKFGKRRMVEFLLRRGARVRLPDDPPWAAPEAWARRRGHTAVAELLRHHERWGADPEAPSVESLESLAAEWAKAFDSHDADALARLSSHFEWDRRPDAKSFREMTRQLLRESTMPAALDPARSREVLARMLGFVDWGDAVDRTRREERLGRRAAVLLAAERARVSGDEAALERLVLDNPETLGPPEATLSVRDVVRRSILREHRFDDWDSCVRHRTAAADPTSLASAFEAAVDAVVDGDPSKLRRLLEERRELVRARSDRNHRATLLHYVGANGVEDFRQRTPPRAVEIAELLLDHGAEVDAVANMYGGATVLGLVATSVHPHRANLQIALLDTLLRRGATLDPQDAGAGATLTVNACLANGRYEAAAFLATRGARLDLEGAAGVGDPNRVRAFFDDTGRLRPEATEDGMLSGFHWACEYGHTEVVRLLLERGADPNRVHRGRTGLHWAAYGGHPDTVEVLLERRASVSTRDETWEATPLGWAMHGWAHPPTRTTLAAYADVARRLVAAGAEVEEGWYEDARARFDGAMASALRGA